MFSSTCAVYGLPQTDLLAETHPIAPISPYAESKARVERALAAAAGRGLRSASLRYFNAAGADAGGAIGEAHDPETHLLPLAADAALGLGPALTLLGTDYPTPDGSCIRDFVHVSDLADAHVRALDWLQRAAKAASTKPSISAAARATACARRSPRPRGSPAAPCRTRWARAGPAIRPSWSATSPSPGATRLAAHARPCRPDRGHAALAPQDAALK